MAIITCITIDNDKNIMVMLLDVNQLKLKPLLATAHAIINNFSTPLFICKYQQADSSFLLSISLTQVALFLIDPAEKDLYIQ